MGHNRTFEIPFVGLTAGEHEFEYRIEDQFFLDFGPQDFSNCQTKVKLHLDKHSGFMQLHFDIDGTIDTLCDRCGNPLSVQLWDEFNLIVKLVDDGVSNTSINRKISSLRTYYKFLIKNFQRFFSKNMAKSTPSISNKTLNVWRPTGIPTTASKNSSPKSKMV